MHASVDEVSGAFEVHLTVREPVDRLAEFARRHALKFSHIMLDRGDTPSQPMVTFSAQGELAAVRRQADRWCRRLRAASLVPVRVKIEAAPWNVGVPQTDDAATDQPAGRYFEHHIKLLLPDASVARLIELTDLVTAHGARLSSNARRLREDGVQERFVTQRCFHVGRATAAQRLDELTDELHRRGQQIAEVEAEYVVEDSRMQLDGGWLHENTYPGAVVTARDRQAPAGTPGYPSTYQPIPARPDIAQRGTFDPALKQFSHAYRAGEPEFADPGMARDWRAARQDAMSHLLGLVATSRWAQHLVLRGSALLRAWLGEAAREPGDLDFVVTPHTWRVDSPESVRMLAGLVAAVRNSPGPGLWAQDVTAEDIWTYERASGRRLVFPFQVADLPRGFVQVDIVFTDRLPVPPVPVQVPPSMVGVRAATPELSLAWKLLWLSTDQWPQGKDLYDATLLAEYTSVPLDLVRDLMRGQLGAEADSFTAETVLRWQVDWANFRDEYPTIHGGAQQWQHRLALALARSFGE
jgi:hypothetical protein